MCERIFMATIKRHKVYILVRARKPFNVFRGCDENASECCDDGWRYDGDE